DSQLNNLWKSLPESVRASMKKEQNLWINEKAKRCGKISDASSTATPVETRIKIYQCQSERTFERFIYLGGDEERQY
ncbi:TPA: lysozyme inhibitor LprI family protein, partial [Enterobacter roggenkampii]